MGSILKIHRVQLPQVTSLSNGQSVTGLQHEAGYWRYYRLRVPEGQSVLTITAGGAAQGELDLFVRHGTLPARHGYDFLTGTTTRQRSARVSVRAPAAGDWYVGLFSWSYEGVELTATYFEGAQPEGSPLTAALQSCCESVVAPAFGRPDERADVGASGLHLAS